ncbi:proteasome subunit domain-containing protein [Ditylenchus destructor]|uniref:Proteasome subunit domain-containing protein n=1 Tax=Ditylenchus destructor TaxID=166010 RepID=A0AAD4QXM0_9BILA|nr:proteasome subunit domain-containing protein [Ditylenchus destructor]
MNFLLGLRTDDYMILAADKNAFAHGAITISSDYNKEVKLGEKLYMTCIGETADVADFSNWTQANIRLYKTRNGYELSPQAAHHWLRMNIAQNLRSEDYWRVNVLLGGYDDHKQTAYLSSIDYLGNGIADQNYLFSGFPGRFCYSIMDSMYRSGMTEEQGFTAIRQCLAECKKRVIVNLNKFTVLIIDKNGARHLPDIDL